MQSDPADFDTNHPHEARMYDYWLGGKDNYQVDRDLGDQIAALIPTISSMAHANRAFMVRAVRHLANAGIRQFLDIGTGIPTSPNVHQIAQAIRPDARVLYIDNDPLVLAHARALMNSTPEGKTAFVLGDFMHPESYLDSDELRDTLDFNEPIAVLAVAVLMYFDPEQRNDPYPVVDQLMQMVPSGSYLTITHPTGDFNPSVMEGVRNVAKHAGMTILPRNQEEVAKFFTGTTIVDPGVVPVLTWRPEDQDTSPADPHAAYYWAGMGRKD